MDEEQVVVSTPHELWYRGSNFRAVKLVEHSSDSFSLEFVYGRWPNPIEELDEFNITAVGIRRRILNFGRMAHVKGYLKYWRIQNLKDKQVCHTSIGSHPLLAEQPETLEGFNELVKG